MQNEDGKMIKVGVLAIQGAVAEHLELLNQIPDVCAQEVKYLDELNEIDGLIIPGGESTAIRRLIDKYDFMDGLKQFAHAGKPVFGTCAGLILLAKNLIGYTESHIGVMDVEVERNSFGRQRESFEASLDIANIAETYHNWRGKECKEKYKDIPGFCKSANIQEIRKNNYILTPGRYIDFKAAEEDGQAFEEKMQQLTATLQEQMQKASKMDKAIRENLKSIGYGW